MNIINAWKILIACEFSGTVRDAFRKRGHDAISADLLPCDTPGPHYQGDVRDLLGESWDLIIAHPPCTALCVTGNRHYAGTQAREDAFNFFMLFAQSKCEQICIENPVGVVSSRFKPPSQYIQPYQFGHPVSKKTGLWLTGLPLLTSTNVVDVEDDVVFTSGKRMSKWFYETSLLRPELRASARSKTFQGIADAMAVQWGAL